VPPCPCTWLVFFSDGDNAVAATVGRKCSSRYVSRRWARRPTRQGAIQSHLSASRKHVHGGGDCSARLYVRRDAPVAHHASLVAAADTRLWFVRELCVRLRPERLRARRLKPGLSLLCGLLGTGEFQYFCLVTVPVHVWGARRILRWMKDPTNKELVFCSSLMPVVGFVHMGLSAAFCRHSHACAAISFYICTWFYGQAANQAIKNVFWRRRPIACLSTCLSLTDTRIRKPHSHSPWTD
jgi:hypothetical protein